MGVSQNLPQINQTCGVIIWVIWEFPQVVSEVNLAALLGFSATGIELEPGRHQRACPPWHVGSRRTRILKRKSLQFRIFLSRYGDGPKLLTPKKSWLQFETLCPPFLSLSTVSVPANNRGPGTASKALLRQVTFGDVFGLLPWPIDAYNRCNWTQVCCFFPFLKWYVHVWSCMYTYICLYVYIFICVYLHM
jgi:hypothetical protein